MVAVCTRANIHSMGMGMGMGMMDMEICTGIFVHFLHVIMPWPAHGFTSLSEST